MGFKFLQVHQLNIPSRERFREMYQQRLNESIHPLPPNELAERYRLEQEGRFGVWLRMSRDRNTIDDQEWNNILERQRHELIDLLHMGGVVIHQIVSQDEEGFTLRTELEFPIPPPNPNNV